MLEATRVIYEQNEFPIFQNRMYDTEEQARACPRGDIRLVQDESSGLIYNQAFCPEKMHYDQHYQNEQAVSPMFQKHLEEVAAIVERDLGRQSIIEIGCGKGFFLERLLARGFDAHGFDPAYEGENPRIAKRPFNPSAGLTAKGLVLRHVLEHLQAPFDFLKKVRTANGGTGLIYIEVPCLDWIRRKRAWFDIYYEHANYFRLADFNSLFADVRASGYLFGGQYLYVVAELASLRKPIASAEDQFVLPDDFLSMLKDTRHQTPDTRHQTVLCWCLGRRIQGRHLRLTSGTTGASS